MAKKFDGCDVVEKTFGELSRFERFFDETGKGYTKHGYETCVDDNNLVPIYLHVTAKVFVKDE